MSRIDSEDQVSASQRLNHTGMGLSYCIWQELGGENLGKKKSWAARELSHTSHPSRERLFPWGIGAASSPEHLSGQLPGCARGVGTRREGDWRLEERLCPAEGGINRRGMARRSDGAGPQGSLGDAKRSSLPLAESLQHLT